MRLMRSEKGATDIDLQLADATPMKGGELNGIYETRSCCPGYRSRRNQRLDVKGHEPTQRRKTSTTYARRV